MKQQGRTRTGLLLALITVVAPFVASADTSPTSAQDLLRRGVACQRRFDMTCAIKNYQGAVALEPKLTAGRVLLGTAYYYSGKRGPALEQFRQALALDPDEADANFYVGFLTNLVENRPAVALPYLEKAKRLRPDHPLVHIHLGQTLKKLGRIEEALAAWKFPIGRGRPATGERENIASTYEEQGKLDEAISLYRDIVRLLPNSKVHPFYLGRALFKKGLLDEALPYLSGEVLLHSAEARYLVGEIYRNKGNREEARRNYEIACFAGENRACAAGRISRPRPLKGNIRYADCDLPIASGYADVRLKTDQNPRGKRVMASFSRAEPIYHRGVSELRRLSAFYSGRTICGIPGTGKPENDIRKDDSSMSSASLSGEGPGGSFRVSMAWVPDEKAISVNIMVWPKSTKAP